MCSSPNHLSKTQPKPRPKQPPPDRSNPTSCSCNPATELGARASGQWAVVRDACGIVSANATVRVPSLMRRGTDRDPNHMVLASLIGIDRKGTRPPLKTDNPNTPVFHLWRYSGRAVAIFRHVLAENGPRSASNPPYAPFNQEQSVTMLLPYRTKIQRWKSFVP